MLAMVEYREDSPGAECEHLHVEPRLGNRDFKA
jgi:hypothetical protein